MGMFVKTLVAGIVAALLAGSVVYYGMPAPDTIGGSSGTVALRGQSQNANSDDVWYKKILRPVKKVIRPEGQSSPRLIPATTSAPPQIDPSAEKVRYYRLEDGEFTEIDAPPARAMIRDSVNPDASMRILAVMEQAKIMKRPELRDRAYLDVVDFALSEELFVPANSAMEKIRQTELRDTARSRIAISLAQRGDSVSAFGLIDEVEIDELRDVMRLQVIEALIPPKPAITAEPKKKR